jgi:type IV pilus assembly protein PilA
MQIKDQTAETSPNNTFPASDNSSAEPLTAEPLALAGQRSEYLQNPLAEEESLQSPHHKRKGLKLFLRVGLYLSFFVGLGITVLPSFLNCGNKAMEFEGRNNIGTINRGQQAYYLEHNKFSSSIPELGIGISPQTINYQYLIQTDRQFVVNYAQSKKPNLKSYLGVAFIGIVPNSDNAPTTQTITCEVDKPQPLASIMPVYQNGTVSCPKGTKQL